MKKTITLEELINANGEYTSEEIIEPVQIDETELIKLKYNALQEVIFMSCLEQLDKYNFNNVVAIYEVINSAGLEEEYFKWRETHKLDYE